MNSLHNTQPQRETQRQAEPARAPRAAEGALLSNTAPSNYINPNFQVLRQGIDSLYLSFHGTISKLKDLELETFKKAAQSPQKSTKACAFIRLNGEEFQVESYGRKPCKYVLRHRLMEIGVASSNAARIPMASVQISAHWLAIDDPLEILSEVAGYISELGTLEGEAQVSRADLFVDFTAPYELDSWTHRAYVGRARKRAQYADANTPTGWAIGAGSERSARLYDKTEELPEEKSYLKDRWSQSGWDGTKSVFRCEFQLRRKGLTEQKVFTLPDLLARLGSLWDYYTQQWLRLTIPNHKDKVQTRWPIHPLWAGLQTVQWDKHAYNDCSREVVLKAPSLKSLCQQFQGSVTSYMALAGVYDPQQGVSELWRETRTHYYGDKAQNVAHVTEDCINRAAVKAHQRSLPYDASCKQNQQHLLNHAKRAHERSQDDDSGPDHVNA